MESTKANRIGLSSNVIVRYPSSFWLMIAAIIFIVFTLFYVNNFTQSSNDKAMNSSLANAECLSDLFHNIENSSVSHIPSLLGILKNDASFIDTAEKTINILCSPLFDSNEAVYAYFYILNDTHSSTHIEKIYYNAYSSSNNIDISYDGNIEFDKYMYEKSNTYDKPFWELCSSGTGEDLISYVVPLPDKIGAAAIIFSVNELFNYIDDSEFSQDIFPLILSAESRNIVSRNSISDSIKNKLIDNQFDNAGNISFKETDLSFYYIKMNDSLIYAEAKSLLHIRFLSNVYIFFLGIAALICVWATQSDRFTGKNIFESISAKIIGLVDPKRSRDVAINSHASAIAFQVTLALSLFIQFLLSIFAYDEPIVSLFYLVILVIGSVGFVLYNKNTSGNLSARIFVFFVTVTPILVHFLLGGYVPEREPYEMFWIACAIIISIFLLSRRLSHTSFSLTIILMLISLVIEMNYFNNDVSEIEVIAFTLNTILVCLLIYSSVEIYYNNSKKDFAVLEEEAIQIKETQSAFVHKEKMVTLGQLIAGVAHEINTPIGAVKAAGETLDTMTNKILKKLISETKDYSDEDLEIFIQIVNMCVASIKEMRSTMETRKAKAVIREYFRSVGLENYAELTNLVTKIEICDLEKIDDNLDLFFHRRITEFLRMAAVVMPFLNSTQTVIFASNRVSKIVFALKTFAHTSSSSEFIWFDVVKNIENIIILYHNQIKAGIEVVQDYDDNIPELFGNPDEVGQVWTNLVQNAIYAMSGIGTLKITIHNYENKWVKVSISDTGAGIKEENLKSIFVPFYTTKPLGEGSGLGLDICKKIIEKHEGTIEVNSKYGSGTTFTISLPIKDKE